MSHVPLGQSFDLEVTQSITSSPRPLVRTSHMILLNYKAWEFRIVE